MPLPQSLLALTGGRPPQMPGGFDPIAALQGGQYLSPYGDMPDTSPEAPFIDANIGRAVSSLRALDDRRLAQDEDYQDMTRRRDASLGDELAGNRIETLAGASMGPNSTALRGANQADALERILHQYENPAQTRADEQVATAQLRDEAYRYASDQKLTGALANADSRHKSDAELGTKLLEEMIQAGHADPRNPGKRIPLSAAEVDQYRSQFGAGAGGGEYTPVDDAHRAVIEAALASALSSKAFPDRASALASLRQHRPDLFK